MSNQFDCYLLKKWNVEFGAIKNQVLENPVCRHYENDIFHVVKICFCINNAMVNHHIVTCEDPEKEDMHKETC